MSALAKFLLNKFDNSGVLCQVSKMEYPANIGFTDENVEKNIVKHCSKIVSEVYSMIQSGETLQLLNTFPIDDRFDLDNHEQFLARVLSLDLTLDRMRAWDSTLYNELLKKKDTLTDMEQSQLQVLRKLVKNLGFQSMKKYIDFIFVLRNNMYREIDSIQEMRENKTVQQFLETSYNFVQKTFCK